MIDNAFETWKRRSQIEWKFDFSHFEKKFNINVLWNEEKAKQANEALVEKAAQRTRI